MSATNYAEAKLADHLLGTTSWTAPSNVFVKLHTGDPGEDATANAATETTRKDVNFGAASNPGGVATSSTDADWINVAATETYSHFSIWDTVGPAGGNPLVTGALTAPVSVTAGDNFSLPSGSLTVTVA